MPNLQTLTSTPLEPPTANAVANRRRDVGDNDDFEYDYNDHVVLR